MLIWSIIAQKSSTLCTTLKPLKQAEFVPALLQTAIRTVKEASNGKKDGISTTEESEGTCFHNRPGEGFQEVGLLGDT